jgi:tetratricopeptide (TPR) repeat protein
MQMSSRRTAILMAVLLVLILGYVYGPDLMSASRGYPAPVVQRLPPLPGKNSISNLVVRQSDAGVWQASFDYFYTGEPTVQVFVRLPLGQDSPSAGKEPPPWQRMQLTGVKRGPNHGTVDLLHPGPEFTGVTRQIIVEMQDFWKRDPAGTAPVIASAQLDQPIDWPTWSTWQADREFAKQSPQQNLDRAIALIDKGSFDEAKSILERLITRDPTLVQGYIELARVAMKTNWGPEGLHHAEGLLASALQIEPNNVNAKILLGYVQAHQKHYRQAETLFAEAAASNPPNLWLWANWGEALAMQGKFEQSAVKYREAIDRPVTHDTYDRARKDAYQQLIALLKRKNDLDGMEALYKICVAEYGYGSCFSADYARFLRQHRGDPNAAIDVARQALNKNCEDSSARQVLGLAHYAVWAKSQGQARIEAMNQARIYLPPGPMPIYLLASSERTVPVAAQLIATGEKVDQKDNENLNALAHAIQREDSAAIRHLLRLGAKLDTPVGSDDMPVALMPVLAGNVEIVKLLQQLGADYARISYHDATAFDFARQTGDTELLDALKPRPQVL